MPPGVRCPCPHLRQSRGSGARGGHPRRTRLPHNRPKNPEAGPDSPDRPGFRRRTGHGRPALPPSAHPFQGLAGRHARRNPGGGGGFPAHCPRGAPEHCPRSAHAQTCRRTPGAGRAHQRCPLLRRGRCSHGGRTRLRPDAEVPPRTRSRTTAPAQRAGMAQIISADASARQGNHPRRRVWHSGPQTADGADRGARRLLPD